MKSESRERCQEQATRKGTKGSGTWLVGFQKIGSLGSKFQGLRGYDVLGCLARSRRASVSGVDGKGSSGNITCDFDALQWEAGLDSGDGFWRYHW